MSVSQTELSASRRFVLVGRDVHDRTTDEIALMPNRQTGVAAARLMNADPTRAADYQWVSQTVPAAGLQIGEAARTDALSAARELRP